MGEVPGGEAIRATLIEAESRRTDVEVALGRFNEMRALADQTLNLEEQLETRKIVDRAKGRLMDEHSMGENDAFSYIQKRAMSDRVTMRVIAEKVIAGDLRPEPK